MAIIKEIKTLKDIPKENLLTGGTFACAGCGAILGLKFVLKALGSNTIMVNVSGCMTLTAGDGYTPYKIPWVHGAIENGAAVATGISMGLKALGKDKGVNIVVYAGDGGTYDIGLQALSGMVARGENVIYVCYNNQSFSNTGFQKSTATPLGARTSTTPVGKDAPIGNALKRKDMIKIMMAHNIPYASTASAANAVDFMRKLRKASQIQGPKYIEYLSPCIPGWLIDDNMAVSSSKAMVDSGLWPLYEIENGKFTLNYVPKPRKPVEEALKMQGRFRHLDRKTIQKIQGIVDEEWKHLEAGTYWLAREY